MVDGQSSPHLNVLCLWIDYNISKNRVSRGYPQAHVLNLRGGGGGGGQTDRETIGECKGIFSILCSRNCRWNAKTRTQELYWRYSHQSRFHNNDCSTYKLFRMPIVDLRRGANANLTKLTKTTKTYFVSWITFAKDEMKRKRQRERDRMKERKRERKKKGGQKKGSGRMPVNYMKSHWRRPSENKEANCFQYGETRG